MIRAVLAGQSTGSGLGLAWFSSLSSERIFFFGCHICLLFCYITLPFSEQSLVGLALDLVDEPSSFSAVML